MKLVLIALLISLAACSAEVPVHETAPLETQAAESGLVRVSETGLQPPLLKLGAGEGAVLFMNDTGQELVTIVVRSASAGVGESAGILRFERAGRGVRTKPLLPGAAAALGLPPGTVLDYLVLRSQGRALVGRVVRGAQ